MTPLGKPTLRQLEYAVAIAGKGSFGAAARHCRVSQPGLSTQIRQLERTLGVAIFERHARGVRLTPAGEQVIAAGRRLLRDVDRLLVEIDALADPFCGTIRLGVIPTIAPYLLPRITPGIHDRFPDLRLLLREEQTQTLVHLIDRGELDLALVAVESELGGLETFPLFEDPFLLAVPAGHRLARRKRVTPTDLAKEEVLLLGHGHCLGAQASLVCTNAGLTGVADFKATSLATLKQMVANGIGVTLLPKMAVAGDPVGGKLALVPFAKPAPRRTIALGWRRSSAHRERFRQFAEGLVPED